jgi:hypothetical protein
MPYESQKERRVTITIVRPAGMAVLVFIPV